MHQKQNMSKTEQSVAIWTLTILLVLQILKKLGIFLYRNTMQKVSDPFDIPVKNVKSRTTAKVYVIKIHKVVVSMNKVQG